MAKDLKFSSDELLNIKFKAVILPEFSKIHAVKGDFA